MFLKAKSTFVAHGSLSFRLVTCNFRKKRRFYRYLSQIGIMFRQFDLALRKNVIPWFFDMIEVKMRSKIEKSFSSSQSSQFFYLGSWCNANDNFSYRDVSTGPCFDERQRG